MHAAAAAVGIAGDTAAAVVAAGSSLALAAVAYASADRADESCPSQSLLTGLTHCEPFAHASHLQLQHILIIAWNPWTHKASSFIAVP